MKVLQTIAGMSNLSGGTSTCTYELLKALNDLYGDVDLLTAKPANSGAGLLGAGEVWMKAVENDRLTSFAISKNMMRFLRETEYDIYHINGLWMHNNHDTCIVARKKHKPYIVTPHGMLYPEALKRSAWKKKLLLSFGGVHKDLKNAACIHATCKQEMLHYRSLGYTNPVAVIPNPVQIPSFLDEIEGNRSIKRIGFLGRLHPYKRPEALIRAWERLGERTKGSELVLMGKGTVEYEQELKNLVTELHLSNVVFEGQVQGRDKYNKLASLTALCVPSVSENFGMTVAETLLSGTPVICTNTAPWEELNTFHCGWWVNNDVDTLASTIEEVLSLPIEEIVEMGGNGRNLILDKYTSEKIANQMHTLYHWIYTGNSKPEFVFD